MALHRLPPIMAGRISGIGKALRLDSICKIEDMFSMTRPEQKIVDPQQEPGQPLSRYERQRERILDAATHLLNQRGISGMTLQEVAEQLGLKTTAVTYYFRYKEQLIVAVFEDSLQRLSAMAEEAGQASTPRERVSRYLEIWFDHYAAAMRNETRPMAILSELRALEGGAREKLIGSYQDIFRAVRNLLGPTDTTEQKLRLTVRAQMLNEADLLGSHLVEAI